MSYRSEIDVSVTPCRAPALCERESIGHRSACRAKDRLALLVVCGGMSLAFSGSLHVHCGSLRWRTVLHVYIDIIDATPLKKLPGRFGSKLLARHQDHTAIRQAVDVGGLYSA